MMKKKLKPFLICFFAACCINTGMQAQGFDADALRSINAHRNKSLDPAFIFITNSDAPIALGSSIITLGTGFIKKDQGLQSKGWESMVSNTLAVGAGYAIKKMANRPRPAVDHAFVDPYKNYTSNSFPSNHTSIAFAAATSMSLNFQEWYVVVPAYTWAGLVGYSRMHLGVHYPSDVIAGAILGSGTAILTHKAHQWIQKKKRH